MRRGFAPVLCVACLCVGVGADAQAPEHAEDAERVSQCAAQNRSQSLAEVERRCAGMIADPCLDRPEAQTTLGTNDCLSREAAAWDVLLNRDWPNLRAKMRQRDVDNSVAALGLTGADSALLAAQRAWLAFREAECAAQAAEWGAGTIGSTMHAACWLEMTARRAIELNRRLYDAP